MYKLEDLDIAAMMAKYNCDEKVITAFVFLVNAIVFEDAIKDHGGRGTVELVDIPDGMDTDDIDKAFYILETKVWGPAMAADLANRASAVATTDR